jgi:hypothetical protein
LKATVRSSTTSMLSTDATSLVSRYPSPVLRRSIDSFTASALSGVPSLNTASSRRFMVNVRPSSEKLQSVASMGSRVISGPRPIRRS